MMNADIATRIVELAETGFAGLEYVQQRNEACCYEQGIPVFLDVLEAFASIEKTLWDHGCYKNNVVLFTDLLRDGISLMVQAYEQQYEQQYTELISKLVIPLYRVWQSELCRTLSGYLSLVSSQVDDFAIFRSEKRHLHLVSN